MPQIKGDSRLQLMMLNLEEQIHHNSSVRLIDSFIQGADLEELGFIVKGKSHEGRPAYKPEILTKLYLYGYLNGIRSSRKLQKECERNIELWWLLSLQKPRYKTIADFRKNNALGFGNLFIYFRDFCIDLDLYGRKHVAIDGSKFRAQNSKKRNYNARKIKQHLEYIDEQQQRYFEDLDRNDKIDNDDDDTLDHLQRRRQKYNKLKEQLDNTDETQISATDPDARAMPIHMNIVEVAYNLQSTVDDKHNLIVDYQVTNKKDDRALAPMALRAKKALKISSGETLTVLADKGYHTAQQLDECHNNGINTIVAIPKKPKQTDRTKPEFLRKDSFSYNPLLDLYTCPNGEQLSKQARYKRKSKGKVWGYFDRYAIKYSICKTCPYINQCVSESNRNSHSGRYIDRYLNDHAVELNKVNVNNNRALYKKRQAIVEHPFDECMNPQDRCLGDIEMYEPQGGWVSKRQWGYTYTLLKTIPKVQTEFSIIALCYNLRRSMSILTHKGLKMALKRTYLNVLSISLPLKHLRGTFFNLHPHTSQRFSLSYL